MAKFFEFKTTDNRGKRFHQIALEYKRRMAPATSHRGGCEVLRVKPAESRYEAFLLADSNELALADGSTFNVTKDT